MNNRHANFEICEALQKLPGGSFTGWDLERQTRLPWNTEYSAAVNARPDRMKICPICARSLPIAEFLYGPETPARTVARRTPNGDEIAYVCADVAEFCQQCNARYSHSREEIAECETVLR